MKLFACVFLHFLAFPGFWKSQSDLISIQKDYDCFLPNTTLFKNAHEEFLQWKQMMISHKRI